MQPLNPVCTGKPGFAQKSQVGYFDSSDLEVWNQFLQLDDYLAGDAALSNPLQFTFPSNMDVCM